MPDAVTVPVNVTVSFKHVVYDAATGVWSGRPSWTVPARVQVRPGNDNIVWTLRPSRVPSGFTAQFNPSDGIYFPENSNWTGGEPALVTVTSIQVSDNFEPQAAAVDYYYGINVILKPETDTGQTGYFNYDPEVENEPGTISHATS